MKRGDTEHEPEQKKLLQVPHVNSKPFKKNVISLEDSIRKMTSLPAQAFRLNKRGQIKEGMFADITIFDYEIFKDKATFSNPHQYSQGLNYVIVNGEIVVENNEHTGRKPGRILFGSGKK